MTKEEELELEKKQRNNLAKSSKEQLISTIIYLSKENNKLKSQTFEDKIRDMILYELHYDTHNYISDKINSALDVHHEYH